MAFTSLYQTAFVSGEWSPKLRRRSDLQRYPFACDTLRNCMVYRQGGAVARAGSVYVADTETASETSRLIPFVVNATTAYALEFGDQYIRFYRNRAQVQSGGSPVQVATPWSVAEVANLKFVQRADTMYITHPDYVPRVLTRTSDTSWALSSYDTTTGPFLDENTTTTTITSSGLSGTVTLTASAALFTADDVGTTWMLRAEDVSALSKWQGNWPWLSGDRALSRNKIYEATTIGSEAQSGVNAPDHVEGEESDGREPNNIGWTYQSSLYAFVTITAFSSSTSVTATVDSDSDIPDGVDSTGTKKWSKAAWSATEGYPTSVAFWQQRLVFSKLQSLYATQVADFQNHSPFNLSGEVDFASAINITVSDNQIDPIKWLVLLNEGILAATRQSLYAIDRENPAEPLGPENVNVRMSSRYGTRDFVQPVVTGGSVLMVDRSGTRLREVREGGVPGMLDAPDRSIFADHLIGSIGFEAAYCEHPHSTYWLAVGDGSMASMTFEPEEQVYAWHRHDIAGTDAFVESVISLPEPTNQAYDDLWMIVSRTVNGATMRTVEYMPRPFDEELSDDYQTWPALDGCVVRDGAATTSITGLDHLEGQTVTALADGFVVEGLTVSSGAVTLPDAASKVQVGLPFTRRIVPLSPDPGSAVGASQAHRQKAQRASVLFLSTCYAELGVKGGTTFDAFDFRRNTDAVGVAVSPFTGSKERKPPGATWDTETLIEIRSAKPLPFAVRGVVFAMNVDTR